MAYKTHVAGCSLFFYFVLDYNFQVFTHSRCKTQRDEKSSRLDTSIQLLACCPADCADVLCFERPTDRAFRCSWNKKSADFACDLKDSWANLLQNWQLQKNTSRPVVCKRWQAVESIQQRYETLGKICNIPIPHSDATSSRQSLVPRLRALSCPGRSAVSREVRYPMRSAETQVEKRQKTV